MNKRLDKLMTYRSKVLHDACDMADVMAKGLLEGLNEDWICRHCGDSLYINNHSEDCPLGSAIKSAEEWSNKIKKSSKQ